MDINKIFNIKTEKEFNEMAVQIFHYQYRHTDIYNRFCQYLKINPTEIIHYKQIPFLPIEFFKTRKILSKNKDFSLLFQSSGTTLSHLSHHYIADKSLYEQSIFQGFMSRFGNPAEYIYLGLLPNYLEKSHSSLVYMVNYLMQLSNKPENGYFLYNHQELNLLLEKIETENKKAILFGVSFALLDFLDSFKPHLKNTMVIETGGMKGRKKEIIKEELLNELKTGFNTGKIYSEYGMTELLSQAYSIKNNVYQTPNWMKILIREDEDPLDSAYSGKSGGINVIDLANIYSCSFIATQDLGKISSHGFEVLGRIDNSDIRGCSLMISE